MFQRYARCPWLIPCESGDSLSYTSSLAAFRAALSLQTQETSQGYHDETILAVPVSIERPGSTSGKKKKKKTSSSVENEVVAAEQSSSGSKGVTDSEEDAMVLDRTVEGGLDGVIGLGSSREFGLFGVCSANERFITMPELIPRFGRVPRSGHRGGHRFKGYHFAAHLRG